MTQAILITAYKNFFHLKDIIKFFGKGFSIYIHIDKKSSISAKELIKLRNCRNVALVVQKYNVNWGGFNHLKAILYLCNYAFRDSDNFYFHLISGHDFPIKRKKDFIKFFTENKDKNFLDFFVVPKPGWADNEGMDRLEYYNFFDVFNWKDSKQRAVILKFLAIQKKLGYKRSISKRIPQLYGGSTWWSLNRRSLEYVMRYIRKNRYFLRRFKYTLCSEEFFFQTILLNSELISSIENNNLRFIDWTYKNGNNPAILDKTDFERILRSDAFFARKFENPMSEGLLGELKVKINF